jgi:hypothetical protein
METILSIAVGLGLAAACGLRVFLPLAGLGIAASLGRVPLADGFAWVASTPALIAFGTATVLEVGAYYVPWLDHALDALATPAAIAAGVLATAAVVTDLPPVLKWAIAVIGGGGAAGLLQGATVILRLKSTAATGGLGNPVLATLELVGAVLTVVLAVVLPLLGLIAAVTLVVWAARRVGRITFGRRASDSAIVPGA